MTDSADLPLDDEDQAILDRLTAVHALLDSPQADLDERVSIAIALDSRPLGGAVPRAGDHRVRCRAAASAPTRSRSTPTAGR